MNYFSIEAHKNSSVNSLRLVENTQFAITGGGNDFLVKLHNLLESYSQTLPKEHTNAVNSIAIAKTRDFFCSTSNDVVVLWDIVKQQKVQKLVASESEDTVRDQIMDSSILNDNLVAVCGTNHRVKFFDLRQKQRSRPIFSLAAGDDNLNTLNFQENNILSIGSSNGNMYSIDLRNQNLITDLFVNGSITSIDGYEEGLLITFDIGLIELIDFKSSKRMLKLSEPCLASYKLNSQLIKDYYSNGLYYIAGASEYGTIHLWSFYFDDPDHIYKAKELHPKILDSKESGILNIVRFASNSNRLVSSSGDGMLHIWDNLI
ncbi:uncharacterized protein PRCAT00001769001 [Priceomyces carsonii]|uniref:uncharacterized protein n=1 Tax=Priceomyces carsonii TaxID=28549 RepID=UPI002ED95957|nr:unnamed protein product [Priceomyces carsonii]